MKKTYLNTFKLKCILIMDKIIVKYFAMKHVVFSTYYLIKFYKFKCFFEKIILCFRSEFSKTKISRKTSLL